MSSYGRWNLFLFMAFDHTSIALLLFAAQKDTCIYEFYFHSLHYDAIILYGPYLLAIEQMCFKCHGLNSRLLFCVNAKKV